MGRIPGPTRTGPRGSAGPTRSRLGRILATIMLVAAWLLLATAGVALAATPQDLATDISTEIASPYCPGVTLHDCPSAAATDLRARITAWAEDGWGRARIMAKLSSEFGPGIRAVPPPGGSGTLAWLLPAGAVIAGAVVVAVLVPRWVRKNHDQAPTGATDRPLSPDERRRVEGELDAFRGAVRGDQWSQ